MTTVDQAFIPLHASTRSDRTSPERLAQHVGLVGVKQAQLRDSPLVLPNLASAPLDAAGIAHILHPSDPRIPSWLRLSARATLAACQLAEPGRRELVVDLGAGPVRLLAGGRPMATPDKVTEALYAALVVRDKDLQSGLANVDLGTLRPSGVIMEAWAIDWARAVQGFTLAASWATDAFKLALEGSDPRQHPRDSLPYHWLANVANPTMALAYALGENAAAFNTALRRALEEHSYFYGEAVFDPPIYQQNDPLGFIALGPLALACVAHDRGWPIEVQSDYLPQSLLAYKGEG